MQFHWIALNSKLCWNASWKVREVPSFPAHPGTRDLGLWLNINLNSSGQWVPGIWMVWIPCLVVFSLSSLLHLWAGGEGRPSCLHLCLRVAWNMSYNKSPNPGSTDITQLVCILASWASLVDSAGMQCGHHKISMTGQACQCIGCLGILRCSACFSKLSFIGSWSHVFI